MRLLTLSLILAAAALMTIPDPVSAQSPTTYPWCSRGGRSSANNCYFTSKEQCQRTISGIGAIRPRPGQGGERAPRPSQSGRRERSRIRDALLGAGLRNTFGCVGCERRRPSGP